MKWLLFFTTILTLLILFSAYKGVADSGPPRTFCGDGTCQFNEACSSCQEDCGKCPEICGNGICAQGESCTNCAKDCAPCPVVCGDNNCQAPETCKTCQKDCGSCPADLINITPPAFETNVEKKEECGGFNSMRERITCRLQLPETSGPLPYTPEECRAAFGDEKQNCIKRYDLVQPCWDYNLDSERVGCARKLLNAENITGQLSFCKTNDCRNYIAEKIFTIAKFKMYNLEEKAERWLGKNRSRIIDFNIFIESKKLDFNKAKNISEKKFILREVQAEWQNLLKDLQVAT